MSYKIEYEGQDLHWQVILMNPTNDERRIVHRFTSRDQAESFVERRTAVPSDKNNSEK